MKEQIKNAKKPDCEPMELARAGFAAAISILGNRTQFGHCRDEQKPLTLLALVSAGWLACERHKKLDDGEDELDAQDDIIIEVADCIAGIAANPETWELMEAATVSENPGAWWLQLKAVAK